MTIGKLLLRSILIICLMIVVAGPINSEIKAQQPEQWTPPATIPGYEKNTEPPYLVADQNRTVHAFSSQQIDNGIAIFYNQWTLEEGWTEPVDILLSPLFDQAWIQGAFLDSHGTMHLIFFGGHDAGANIYYSQAPATRAGQARAWLTPVLIGENAKTPRSAALAGDLKGNLIVLYHGNQDGPGLYAVHSFDDGKFWSDPEPVFLTYSNDLYPYFLQTHLGKSGHLHAVWNVVDIFGQNVAGYYSQLNPESMKWKTPIELDTSQGLGISIPAVIEHAGTIFVMYNNGHPSSSVAPVQLVRHSNNGGQTWTEPIRPFTQHVGRNGVISFVVDNNDDLHVFFGQRIPTGGAGATHGMWHSMFIGGRWTAAEPIISGPQITEQSEKGFDPYDARAIVIQGNVILVTWRSDPGQVKGGNGVWYSYKILDAPELPVVALPTQPVIPTATPTIMPTPIQPTPTPSPHSLTITNRGDLPPPQPAGNPVSPVIIGVVPVIFIIVTIITVRRKVYQ